MQLYVVTYYGAQWEDSYHWIEAIFDDRYKAEALKLDIEKRVKANLAAPEPYQEEEYHALQDAEDWENPKMDLYSDWSNRKSNAEDFGFVGIKEYELNKVV